MRAVLGIGNPGRRYESNRHNVGFMLLDTLAKNYSLSFKPSKYNYHFCEGKINEFKFSLIKPSTFVNNSGIAALEVLENYNIGVEELLVVHDDINLEFSIVKPKTSGSDGGHNGVSSIIYHLISDQFPRIRIGIGNDFDKGEMANFVLSDFNEEEKQELDKIFEKCKYLIEEFIIGGKKQLLDANSKLSNDTQ